MKAGKLRVHCFAVSIDGYGAGPRQDLANPLGVGGIALHQWAFETQSFKRMHGSDGGTTGIDDKYAARGFAISERGYWDGTCSVRIADLGSTRPGRGGGEIILLTILPFSC